MAFTDFLTEGADIPAGSAITSTNTQSQGPEWLTDYVKTLLAQQAATGGAAYSPYTGPRVAPFTPDQINSFQQTRDAAGAYRPGLDQAAGTVGRAAGTSSAGAAQPWLNAAGNTLAAGINSPSGLGAATPLTNQGAGAIQGALGQPGGAAAGAQGFQGGLGMISQGVNAQTGAQAGQPGFQGGLNAINEGLGQTQGFNAAMPWLTAASGNVADVSAYMNPYEEAVVNRIGDLGVRNLNEKIMPGLEGRYIKAGQFQGSGQMTDTARAIRDTSADILAQQAQLMQQGYTSAQTAKGADLSRYGTLGATAGNLAGSDRSTTIQGGAAAGNIGSSMASAAEAARQNTIQAGQAAGTIGSNMAGAANADRQTGIAGGTALGSMGQNLGALATQDRNALVNAGQAQGALGQTAGSLTGQDAQTMLAAGKTQAEIAAQQQALGLTGANAVNASGNQQQALNQKNFETAYADFLRQQGWGQEQIDKQVASLKGLEGSMPKQVTKEGIEPVSGTTDGGTWANIASGLAGAGGALADIFGK